MFVRMNLLLGERKSAVFVLGGVPALFSTHFRESRTGLPYRPGTFLCPSGILSGCLRLIVECFFFVYLGCFSVCPADGVTASLL